MIAEQQRELWLKRALPALVVLTGYFVVLGPGAVAEAAKAQQETKDFLSRGIAADALPGLSLRKQQVDEEVARLKQSQAALDQALREQVGFLAQQDKSAGSGFAREAPGGGWAGTAHHDYANQLVSRVSAVLTQNGLRVRDAAEAGSDAQDLSPPAVRDIAAKLVKEGEKPKLGGWRFRFRGAYPRVHQALHELAGGEFPVLPLYLSMVPPAELGSEMEWTLVMWTETVAPAKAGPNAAR